MELSRHELALSFTKRENNPEDDSEMCKAAIPTTVIGLGDMAIFPRVRGPNSCCPGPHKQSCPKAAGMGLLPRAKQGNAAAPEESVGRTTTPGKLENRTLSKKDDSQTLKLNAICSARFGLNYIGFEAVFS